MQDLKYRDFHQNILGQTRYELIGIRVPLLRDYARKLIKEKEELIFEEKYYEEVLIEGFCIAYAKDPFEDKIDIIENFLPKIDNWAICDSFVSSLKQIRKNKELYYPYVQKYLESNEEFIQRYALVVLLNYYIDDEYLQDLFRIIKDQPYCGYYVKMAGAWLLSYLFMFYYEETLQFVQNEMIDEEVRKKGIRKALDSYRLSTEQKDQLRRL